MRRPFAGISLAAALTASFVALASLPTSARAAALEAPRIRAAMWVNAEPDRAIELTGAVTLVEFWTFACWNCKNVEPHVKNWHAAYASKGLRVIGVHSPELAHERVVANVRSYVATNGIEYPVAIDNDFAIWRSFGVRAWPTWYLVDHRGRIRYVHEGEGGYSETESKIRELLASDSSH